MSSSFLQLIHKRQWKLVYERCVIEAAVDDYTVTCAIRNNAPNYVLKKLVDYEDDHLAFYISTALTIGNMRIVKWIIQNRHDVSSILFQYYIHDHVEHIGELCSYGVDLRKQNWIGDASIHIAVKSDYHETVEGLVAYDRSLLDLPNSNGDTPLHCACTDDSINVIKVLVELGADKNKRNNRGDTILHSAARFDAHLDTIQFMVEVLNIDVLALNNDGFTAGDLTLPMYESQRYLYRKETIARKTACLMAMCSANSIVRLGVKSILNNFPIDMIRLLKTYM
jgi:hypothetical protein